MSELAPAPRRESSEDRRQAIAEAALALVAEHGFEGLRTRAIAERVGINIATLHYHVPTKAALSGLVADALSARFRAQPIARPRDHLPPAAQLEHEFYDFLEMHTEHPELLVVISELIGRAQRDPDVREAVQPILYKWHGMIAAILAAGRADGSFRRDLDPDAGATLVIGALKQFSRQPDRSLATYHRLCAELRRALGAPPMPQQDLPS